MKSLKKNPSSTILMKKSRRGKGKGQYDCCLRLSLPLPPFRAESLVGEGKKAEEKKPGGNTEEEREKDQEVERMSAELV